jgi:FkbM family methyltransferase
MDMLRAHDMLAQLDRDVRCDLQWDAQRDALLVEHLGARYYADCFEEVYILLELLLYGDYDLAPHGDCILLDVGANVGFTSIFLATQQPGLLVEGFEPLRLNYEKALRNFRDNPSIGARVSIFNEGLYSQDGEMEISSASGHRGMSSVVFDRSEFAHLDAVREPVRLRRASTIVNEVKDRHPGRRIVVKMDCEGSEYAIFEELCASKAMDAIDFVIMEWHRPSADPGAVDGLRDLLRAAGFHTYFRGRLQVRDSVGMAVAFKAPVLGRDLSPIPPG